MKSLLLAFVVLFLTSSTFAIPARVLIIRHGEKPADASNEDLSPKGFQRARLLPTLFARQPELLTFGKPVAIFAFSNSGGHSARGIETATPLAQSLHLPINSQYTPDQTAAVSQYILQDPAYNGKMVMMVWRHSDIQNLSIAFGVSNAPAWDPNVFDRIWQIDFDPSGQVVSFKSLPQNLLPGDSTNYAELKVQSR